jgi:hypothetical protein
MKELFLVIFFFFAALFVVFIIIAFGTSSSPFSLPPQDLITYCCTFEYDHEGWYLVWTLLVRRFRFVRELFQIKESSAAESSEALRNSASRRRDSPPDSNSSGSGVDSDADSRAEEDKENHMTIESTKYSPTTTKMSDKPRPNPAHKLHID